MYRYAALLGLIWPLFAAPLPVAKPEEAGMSSERLQRLSTVMRGYIQRGEIAGTVTGIVRRGKLVHLEAQGLMDADAKTPMRTDAIFRLASMTKPITSVAVMMLLEEGRFLLTDPISKFIPEFKDPKVMVVNPPGAYRGAIRTVPADREITIRDLLTHTAGLACATSVALREEFQKFQAGAPAGETIAGYTKRLAKLPLNFQPGTAWEYGQATNVLGYLVEVVSGMPFDRFMEERLTRPLGMRDTFFYVPDNKLDRLATLCSPGPRNARPAREMRGSRVFFAGAGGLFSTAEDFLRFSQMMLNGGTLDGARILSRKSIELMTANHIGNLPIWPDLPGYRFGLGVRVMMDLGKSGRLDSIGSYGWSGAFGTWQWIDPKEEMAGVLMIQTTAYDNIRFDAQNLALQAIVD
jgi:CubicO group peptidase (beta-lactamase class C family)